MSGQDEPNPALWLATRTGKMELSCPLGTMLPQNHILNPLLNKLFRWRCLVIGLALVLRVYGPRKKIFWAIYIQPFWPHTWSITHIYYILLRHHIYSSIRLTELKALSQYFAMETDFVQVTVYSTTFHSRVSFSLLWQYVN